KGWKAFWGFGEAVLVGRSCRTNSRIPPRAGGDGGTGRSKRFGWKSGARFSANSTNASRCSGVNRSWTAVLLRPKKGLRSGQNPPGERHEVDGGGRRHGSSFGRLPSLCIPGGGPPRGDDARNDRRRTTTSCGPPPAKPGARDRRRRLRQRPVAPTTGETRNRVDRAPSPEPEAAGDPGWASLPAV